jgi:hypothetical protein
MANVDLTIAHWENVAATRKAVLEIASDWKARHTSWEATLKMELTARTLSIKCSTLGVKRWPSPTLLHR